MTVPLSNLLLVNLVIISAAAYCSWSHSGVKPLRYLKKTFAPSSWREFLAPPCPFCWLARGFLAGSIVLVFA